MSAEGPGADFRELYRRGLSAMTAQQQQVRGSVKRSCGPHASIWEYAKLELCVAVAAGPAARSARGRRMAQTGKAAGIVSLAIQPLLICLTTLA